MPINNILLHIVGAMAMRLFDYQESAIQSLRNSLKSGCKRPLLAMPTGGGKTIVAAHMFKSCLDRGKKPWFMCDRIQLVEQTIDKFRQVGIRDFGVIQADHDLKNTHKNGQIVSIQSYSKIVEKHRGQINLSIDLMIVDECSTQYEIIRRVMEERPNLPVIGLDATPYSKELGILYDDLIVPVTTRELEDKGRLTPTIYYAGISVDRKKIKSNDANTLCLEELEAATDRIKEELTGDVIKNWLQYGERSQTIAFSPSLDHSKHLCQRFNEMELGIAEHIDCYDKPEYRQELIEAHNAGEFKILSCSRLLGIGYDSPTTRCLIDCYPIKSVRDYVQRAGRIKRVSESKEYAIYLDHAGNLGHFKQFPEDITPTELHDGEKPHREQDLTRKDKEEKDSVASQCPQCYQTMIGRTCKACGHELPQSNYEKMVIDDGQMLSQIGTKANQTMTTDQKSAFLSSMQWYAKSKGYKETYASMQYKNKFGVWPEGISIYPINEMSPDAKKWIKHQNITRAKAS